VSAKDFLKEVGAVVSRDFLQDRSILSFEEYLELFLQGPHAQVRNSAQYLHDVLDHFGTAPVQHPSGPMRRFKLFDLTDGERMGRVAGQEEVQNALYRLLGNFVRAGAVNKLILLHGPNGSAKSTLVDALKRGMELYSREPQGALYELAWIFPSEKLVKGSIGFGDRAAGGELTTFAHLDEESVEVRVTCEMRDHPLFAMPRAERRKLLEKALGSRHAPATARRFSPTGSSTASSATSAGGSTTRSWPRRTATGCARSGTCRSGASISPGATWWGR
jgi:predicted Ser/Thr protein kinase